TVDREQHGAGRRRRRAAEIEARLGGREIGRRWGRLVFFLRRLGLGFGFFLAARRTEQREDNDGRDENVSARHAGECTGSTDKRREADPSLAASRPIPGLHERRDRFLGPFPTHHSSIAGWSRMHWPVWSTS